MSGSRGPSNVLPSRCRGTHHVLQNSPKKTSDGQWLKSVNLTVNEILTDQPLSSIPSYPGDAWWFFEMWDWHYAASSIITVTRKCLILYYSYNVCYYLLINNCYPFPIIAFFCLYYNCILWYFILIT